MVGMSPERGRDRDGRARQQRPRDELGRPLPFGTPGVDPVPDEPLPPDRALGLARELLEQGRPFAAHEVLEARWKAAPAAERDLWQGLAQLCVGLTHAARGNAVGAALLVERGTARLTTARPQSFAAAGIRGAEMGGIERLDVTAVTSWALDALTRPELATAPPDGWPR